MKRTLELITEEAAWDKVPDDVPLVRRVRWALLHGESMTADECADRYEVTPSTLSQQVGTLREAGIIVDETREGNRKRFSVAAGHRFGAPKPRQAASNRLAAPALGTRLTVVMTALDAEGVVLVLLGENDERWPVLVQGAPL